MTLSAETKAVFAASFVVCLPLAIGGGVLIAAGASWEPVTMVCVGLLVLLVPVAAEMFERLFRGRP